MTPPKTPRTATHLHPGTIMARKKMLADRAAGVQSKSSSRITPMEPDRARAVAQVASVMVDTARVEVEYLKVTKQDCSSFIDGLKAPEAISAINKAPGGGTIDHSKPGVVRNSMGSNA